MGRNFPSIREYFAEMLLRKEFGSLVLKIQTYASFFSLWQMIKPIVLSLEKSDVDQLHRLRVNVCVCGRAGVVIWRAAVGLQAM
jgi:hypothetical protein